MQPSLIIYTVDSILHRCNRLHGDLHCENTYRGRVSPNWEFICLLSRLSSKRSTCVGRDVKVWNDRSKLLDFPLPIWTDNCGYCIELVFVIYMGVTSELGDETYLLNWKFICLPPVRLYRTFRVLTCMGMKFMALFNVLRRSFTDICHLCSTVASFRLYQ